MNKVIEHIASLKEIDAKQVNNIWSMLYDLDIPSYIEFVKEIKKLLHHKDTTAGLFAMDSEPGELLHKFWQRRSDACPLECTEAEKQEAEFREFVKNYTFQIEFK